MCRIKDVGTLQTSYIRDGLCSIKKHFTIITVKPRYNADGRVHTAEARFKQGVLYILVTVLATRVRPDRPPHRMRRRSEKLETDSTTTTSSMSAIHHTNN